MRGLTWHAGDFNERDVKGGVWPANEQNRRPLLRHGNDFFRPAVVVVFFFSL